MPITPERSEVAEAAAAMAAELRDAGVRVKLDERQHVRPGAKFFEWELKGAPVRLEVGARDLAGGHVTLVRRDGDVREEVPRDAVPARTDDVLREIQLGLLADARSFRDRHTRRIAKRAEMMEFLSEAQGFAVTAWCGSADCESAVKAQTSATIRCLTLEREDPGEPCPVCGRGGTELATWGQAY